MSEDKKKHIKIEDAETEAEEKAKAAGEEAEEAAPEEEKAEEANEEAKESAEESAEEPEKDEEAEKKAAEKFANDVQNADTSKYKTDEKHIAKMKAYFDKQSDPERLVKSIKDDNKLVARWIAAIKMGWEEAISVFGHAISDRKLLTKAEIVAYTEKYKAEDERVE